ncbi:MAG: EAL domain-containing response regulator [Vicinamibacteria bacterium]|nr:EAL domain-containing response regulator [Vicinamibacteria bacterium]
MPAHESPPQHGDAKVPRVLLIDDDDAVRQAYAELLSNSGTKVDAAGNGIEAIALLQQTPYDAIVSDITMPGMDGVQFLRAVRDLDLDVPVILYTGNPALESAVRAVEHGAFRYLLKPVAPRELQETVQRAIRLHGLARLKRQALELTGHSGKALGDRAGLEGRFERALKTLWIAFQPIVSHSRRAVVAYEGLVRNDEPTMASPHDFFDAAERLHRIHEVGRSIRKHVAEACVDAPPETNIFVNLHPFDLEDEHLYAVDAPLSANAKRVVLELTERAPLHEIPDIRLRVRGLRALGFRVAVDDLGAGYAGLGALAQFEPDIVKIDMSLVRDVDSDATKQTVIRSMATLCGELGISFVAEGIETPEERDVLTQLGCDLFQGTLFAAPARGFPVPCF